MEDLLAIYVRDDNDEVLGVIETEADGSALACSWLSGEARPYASVEAATAALFAERDG